jgi:hypothetical protein
VDVLRLRDNPDYVSQYLYVEYQANMVPLRWVAVQQEYSILSDPNTVFSAPHEAGGLGPRVCMLGVGSSSPAAVGAADGGLVPARRDAYQPSGLCPGQRQRRGLLHHLQQHPVGAQSAADFGQH